LVGSGDVCWGREVGRKWAVIVELGSIHSMAQTRGVRALFF
jgi:hypothetical protein